MTEFHKKMIWIHFSLCIFLRVVKRGGQRRISGGERVLPRACFMLCDLWGGSAHCHHITRGPGARNPPQPRERERESAITSTINGARNMRCQRNQKKIELWEWQSRCLNSASVQHNNIQNIKLENILGLKNLIHFMLMHQISLVT